MAANDPDRMNGPSCTATLDWAARTLTFDHRGMFRSKAQKASPVIVPFNEIASVTYDGGPRNGWFRITRHGHEPWKSSVASDPHGMNCSVNPTEFAQRVQHAAGLQQPTPEAAQAPDQPDPAADADADTEAPKPDGKVVKAVDGVLDFLSKW